MIRNHRQLTLALILFLCSIPVVADDHPPASQPQTNPASKGNVGKYTFDKSLIFPGTTRDYWVYVPRQYDPAKPACVYVNQDGIQFNAPAVFDRLIAAGEMPVTVGVFVTPGRVKAPSEQALDRFNRSYEYDGLGDNYVRFLLDELLPHVVREQKLNLSTNGNDRCIGGSSSGAICAFTAAWERPDDFRRVFSSIGTYVGLRGGNDYPTLIRKCEPKPLRVFLQDGSSDLNIYGGDWWMVNQEMERALTFAGYEVSHIWGEGGHNGKQATEVFPDAMRWLWKDWPAPPHIGQGSQPLRDVLLAGEAWKAAGAESDKTLRMMSHSIQPIGDAPLPWAIGPDGRQFVASGAGILVLEPSGKSSPIAPDLRANGIVVDHAGRLYATSSGVGESGKLWLVESGGDKRSFDAGIAFPTGITMSPDQSLLYVADGRSHWVYSYQIQADGSLNDRQKYYRLHTPDSADDSGAGGLCVDRDGRLYVATRMGIQVCDQAGRVNCIIPVPAGVASSMCFGGESFDTLYVTCDKQVYSRKLKIKGALASEPPIKPAAPKL